MPLQDECQDLPYSGQAFHYELLWCEELGRLITVCDNYNEQQNNECDRERYPGTCSAEYSRIAYDLWVREDIVSPLVD